MILFAGMDDFDTKSIFSWASGIHGKEVSIILVAQTSMRDTVLKDFTHHHRLSHLSVWEDSRLRCKYSIAEISVVFKERRRSQSFLYKYRDLMASLFPIRFKENDLHELLTEEVGRVFFGIGVFLGVFLLGLCVLFFLMAIIPYYNKLRKLPKFHV